MGQSNDVTLGADYSEPGEDSSSIGNGSKPIGSAKADGLASVNDCATARAKGYLKRDHANINFTSNHPLRYQCNWFAKYDTKVGGIQEWRQRFNVPSGRVICKIDFQGSGSMVYDDAILLTINNKHLFSGSLGLGRLPFIDGFKIYNPNLVIGSRTDAPNYCASGHIVCNLPPTETAGNIDVRFNDDVNMKIMREVESLGGADFTFRAFGDDDPKIDCRHTGINMKTNNEYFNK